jgi:acetyl-CoA carboxylase biotin carboxyl carrier protein
MAKPSSPVRVAAPPSSSRESSRGSREAGAWISPDDLATIAEVMARYDVTELTQTRGRGEDRVRVTIRRGAIPAAPVAVAPALATSVAHAHPTPNVAPHAPAPAAAAAPAAEEGIVYVTSPLVGTFYRSPSPDSAPFIDIGARIRAGQRLCIVEAMKLMNEIEAEFEGTVLEILVENGKPVEYGQKLFKVKKG